MQVRKISFEEFEDEDQSILQDIFEYFTAKEQRRYGAVVLSLLPRKPEGMK